MQWEDEEPPAPSAGKVRVRHTAIGLNYIDTYHRSGLYKLPVPSRIGVEGAGVVDAVGDGVASLKPGDRVCYAGGLGSYATHNMLPETQLIRIPDAITDETAAASTLKGLTACYLLTRTYAVSPNDTVLIHAAAGGMGLILCQWATQLGATVIGTAGTTEKAELASANGAHHTIVYESENVVERVKELTDGRGVQVVYDGVGKATYQQSLDALAPRGMFVSYGNASGNAPAVEPHDLQHRGSLFFTRPSLAHYSSDPRELQAMAHELFSVIRSGAVQIHVNQRFALADAVEAHKALESRATSGSTIFLP